MRGDERGRERGRRKDLPVFLAAGLLFLATVFFFGAVYDGDREGGHGEKEGGRTGQPYNTTLYVLGAVKHQIGFCGV